MPRTTIDIPLAAGLETRDDPKLLPPTKLLDLQNATLGKGRATQKRNGYTALSQSTLATSPATISSATKLATRGDELVLLGGSKLYSYAENHDRWLDRGTLALFDVAVDPVANEVESQPIGDCGTANGVTVYAWENEISAATRTTKFAVVDSTGAPIQVATSLGSNLKAPRVLVIGSIILVLVHDTSANDLKVKRIDTSSAANLATSLASALIALGYSDIHDTGDPHAYSNGTYAVFAVRTTGVNTPVRVGVLMASGAVGGNSDGYGTAAVSATVFLQGLGGTTKVPVAIHLNASNVGFLVWEDGGIVKSCAVTNIVSGAGAITYGAVRTVENIAADVERLTCLSDATTDTGHVWYSFGTSIRTKYQYTNAGVLSGALTRYQCSLASHAFYVGSAAYVNLHFEPAKTFLLCDTLFLHYAKEHAGVAYWWGSVTARSHLPSVSGAYEWVGVYQRRLAPSTSGWTVPLVYTEPSLSRVRYSASTSVVSSAEHREVLFLGSGILWQYDGVSGTDVGFLDYPRKSNATPSNSTGLLSSSGVYTYVGYWEWFDALGNREMSTSAGAFTVTMGATDDTVTITWNPLPFTHKQGTRSAPILALYRSALNGTVRYRVSSQNPSSALYLANSPGGAGASLSFVDTVSDATLVTNELDPYQPSPTDALPVDAVPPPGLRALHVAQERVWGVAREYTRRVYFSKLPLPETAVEWNDGLYIEFPEDITGVADVLGRPVFFSTDHIYVVDGEGPDNLGVGTYSRVEQLPADVGLYQADTLRETPLGWLFLSRKGFRMLTAGLQVPPDFGNSPNAYASQTYTGAELISGANAVRFLVSSGSTLHYDFERDQWSRFTSHTGVSSIVWRGVYCYVTSGGLVRKEAAGAYTEGGSNIAQVWETAWIRVAGIQGFYRALRIGLLGNWKSAHTVTCQVAYDDVDTYVETFTLTPTAGTIAGTAAYTMRHRLGRQKCSSIKFKFTEVPGTGAGLELNALALEIRTKDGINRLGDRTI